MSTTDEVPREPSQEFAQISAFQQQIIWAVETWDGRPIGAEIRAQVAQWRDETVNPSRIYQNIGELVDAELVEKLKRDGRAYEYELTSAGSTASQAYRNCVVPDTGGE